MTSYFGVARNAEGGANYHFKHFPNSIASDYLRRNKDFEIESQINNYDILSDIVIKKSKKVSIPKKNTLVLHLRVGDAIDKSKNNVNEILSKPCPDDTCGTSKYYRPIGGKRGLYALYTSNYECFG